MPPGVSLSSFRLRARITAAGMEEGQEGNRLKESNGEGRAGACSSASIVFECVYIYIYIEFLSSYAILRFYSSA